MKPAAVPNLGASLALGAFVLLADLCNAIYAVHGRRPSSAFLLLCYLGVAGLVAHWILADCRRLGVPRSVDQGWLLLACWPLVLPYHLIKTRRSRGLVTLGGFV